MDCGQAAGLAQAGINGVAQLCGDICTLLLAPMHHRGQFTRLAALPEIAGNRQRWALRHIIKSFQPCIEHALVAATGHVCRFYKLYSHGAAWGKQQQVGTNRQSPPQQHFAKIRGFARGPIAKRTAPQARGAHQYNAQVGHFLQNQGRARGSAKILLRRAIYFARRVQQDVIARLQAIQHLLHTSLNAHSGIGPVLHNIRNKHGMQGLGRQPSHGALHLALIGQRARRKACNLRVNNDGVNKRGMVGHKQYGPRARNCIKPLGCNAVAQP